MTDEGKDVLSPEQRRHAERLCTEFGILVDDGLLEEVPLGPATAEALEDMAQLIVQRAPGVALMPEGQGVLVLQYLQERAVEHQLVQMEAEGLVECDRSTQEPRYRLTARGKAQRKKTSS